MQAQHLVTRHREHAEGIIVAQVALSVNGNRAMSASALKSRA